MHRGRLEQLDPTCAAGRVLEVGSKPSKLLVIELCELAQPVHDVRERALAAHVLVGALPQLLDLRPRC